MNWIARPADACIAAWLDGRGGSRLLTVYGLGGAGTSTSVKRAVSSRSAARIDLQGAESASQIRARLRAVSSRADLVWIDQVHEPRTARAAIAALLERTGARVIASARRPLGLEHERRVALGLLDREGTEALLGSELERLGVHPRPDLRALARAVDGWPIAARVAALHARVLGAEAVGETEIATDPSCRALLTASTRSLGREARAMLRAISFARTELGAIDVARRFDGVTALADLTDRSLVIATDGLVRVPAPIAWFVRTRLAPRTALASRREYAAMVLEAGERARAGHRRDPIGRGAALERLREELVHLALDRDPRIAVRAALALEPLSMGRLARREVLSIWAHAGRAAASLDERAQADVALGLARTLIARGDHESASEVLLSTDALAADPHSAAYRSIYLGHIAAWRGALAHASSLLDEALRILEAAVGDRASLEDAREDALLQRVFVAHQAGDLDETDRLARASADRAARRPSPRALAIARRFSAEVMIRRGAPARAVPLLRQTRDELASQGDHAGSIFTASRLIEALRAAGDHRLAEEEAHAAQVAAARAGEGTLEVTVLGPLGEDQVSSARVADLAWRVQIPALREEAERWLSGRTHPSEIVLRLDRSTSTASIGARSLCLARRATLWRVLDALVEAHERVGACTSEALFRVGWSGERAEPASQKKRVQTAVWTLRRGLLGEVLSTRPEGYALSPDVRIERVG